jgi:hypothetical protein
VKRLLITGSRNWDDPVKLSLHFGQAMGYLRVPISEIEVVHGAAGGVDQAIDRICRYYGYKTDPYPVTSEDWKRYGKSAGHRRNMDMVASQPQPDLCTAFIATCDQDDCPQQGEHGSHGAAGCAFLADKFGIETWRFYSDDYLGVSTVPPLGGAQTA